MLFATHTIVNSYSCIHYIGMHNWVKVSGVVRKFSASVPEVCTHPGLGFRVQAPLSIACLLRVCLLLSITYLFLLLIVVVVAAAAVVVLFQFLLLSLLLFHYKHKLALLSKQDSLWLPGALFMCVSFCFACLVVAHARTRPHTYAHTHIRTHTHTHTQMHAHVHTFIRTYMHTHAYTHMHTQQVRDI